MYTTPVHDCCSCAGVQLLVHYEDQGYAEALTTSQCNKFLQLCVADMADNGTYPEAETANNVLLAHMAETQQPAPDMTSFTLVLDSMLLSLSQQHEDVTDQADKVLLSLYSSFLPMLHSFFSTSADTCVLYTQAMAAFRRINNMPAAFQVFLLMVQNQVEGLTPDCCEEVLELLTDDSSSALLGFVEQHCGGSFLELLAINKDAVIQLPPHGSLPTLTTCTSPDGSVQRLSVDAGPTPAWMLPAWQRCWPDEDAAAFVPGSSMDMSSTTHAAGASSGHGDNSADQLQPQRASQEMMSADYNVVLQELFGMPKSKVSSITQFAAGLTLQMLYCETCSDIGMLSSGQRLWRQDPIVAACAWHFYASTVNYACIKHGDLSSLSTHCHATFESTALMLCR